MGEEEAAAAVLGGRNARGGVVLAAECQEVLEWAQARIDELIGLTEAKEHFTMWRTALQTSHHRLEHSGAVTSSAENHMVFLGAPGTAKRTFARVIAEVLFGVGTLTRPDVTKVAAHHITVSDPARSTAKMKEVCEQARGGVLFIDQAHRLVSDTEDHCCCGVDAIITLQACMAQYCDELVVILAGYPGPMQDFLTAHTGLAARFPVTLAFASYTPEEIVALGHRFAVKEHLVVEDTAWQLLGAEATRLRSIPYGPGTLLDVAGNARYVGEVIAVCRRARTRRLRRLAPSPRDLEQLVCTDPCVLNVSAADMGRAIAAARPAVAP
ncbi:hypothetical protein BMG05_19240 [Mycobacterium malmoense]|nr:hypothetical protein BMG05_19240 [Mycobacterium malmoense]